jgi:hypothetical protein
VAALILYLYFVVTGSNLKDSAGKMAGILVVVYMDNVSKAVATHVVEINWKEVISTFKGVFLTAVVIVGFVVVIHFLKRLN